MMIAPSMGNAWLFSLPFFAIGLLFIGMKKDMAKRMSDMTGYTAKERALTVSASMAPYPFMAATVWIPLTAVFPLLCIGSLLYIAGMAFFVMSLKVIVDTAPNELFSSGPYRFTRNPLYVAATMVFLGICIATASIALTAYLAASFVLQHFMILAEERICLERYGKAYEEYTQRVPRYISH
jgi:protein-S-isoprenylcysteine O-methyltransferase Ste14